MEFELLNLKIVILLTCGFALAALLGYFSHQAKLSPILGYLCAGYLIGPYSPGYVADLKVAEELAEIGVILMMVGVGLHFKWQDLLRTYKISIPGALFQTLGTAICTTFVVYTLDWPIYSGIIFGLAIGVASTVVLVRVLSDNHLLNTSEGHIAVGWLIVEDIITVMALLIVPTLVAFRTGQEVVYTDILISLGIVTLKFVVLVLLAFTLGRKLIPFLFEKILQTKSNELFTLAILAITFVIATGSALLFGTSIALGAFIAGMIIGQIQQKVKVINHAMPIQDTFVVIFFLAVGMLFNPMAIVEHFPLLLATLAIILGLKPLIAAAFMLATKYPARTMLTISIALAQIGEFSFILSEEAMRYNLIPDEGFDVIVAAAFITIALNPLLFKICRHKSEGKAT